MNLEKWTIEAETGYKPITTFWQDFTIAEKYGKDAVKETYDRAFNEWKDNYKYLTELVLVLNHKLWRHSETNKDLALVYQDLWEKTDNYALDNLKGEEQSYFLSIID